MQASTELTLIDLVERERQPEPWSEGEHIPWNEPGFSRRMLKEHLSQEHDAASRRQAGIDRHVDWIHTALLERQSSRILDLGCGPGLYAARLARLGHVCRGIDFSPASIEYARESCRTDGLACEFVLEDIRQAQYGEGYDLAMLIFGEFNIFRPSDAVHILANIYRALAPGGLLLLEPHTYAAVQKSGYQPSTWYSSLSGLFSPEPHLVLEESSWDADRQTATTRFFILDAGSGRLCRYAQSFQAYTNEQYRSLVEGCGFGEAVFYPSLTGHEDESQKDFFALVARKA